MRKLTGGLPTPVQIFRPSQARSLVRALKKLIEPREQMLANFWYVLLQSDHGMNWIRIGYLQDILHKNKE
jgi:hypothetical protein